MDQLGVTEVESFTRFVKSLNHLLELEKLLHEVMTHRIMVSDTFCPAVHILGT